MRRSLCKIKEHEAARYVFGAAIFVPCYLALDWASYIEPLGSFNITPWNPGPGLAIVWMLRTGIAKAPAVFAATFLADAVVRDAAGNYGVTLLNALALTIGYALIAATLRRVLSPKRTLHTIRDLTAFFSIVVVGAAVIGAAFLAVLTTTGSLNPDLLLPGLLRFWIGDVVGILVTAPMLLVVADLEGRASLVALMRSRESYLQIGLLIGTLSFLMSGITRDPSHGFYLLFPPMIWIALRSGLAGAVVAIVIVQLGVIVAFHQQVDQALPIIELQALVATLTLTALYLGAMVYERQEAMERLNQSLHLAAAGEMAGAITHEVSQPLTALASYSRSAKLLVKAGRGDAELGGIIDKIFSESLRASQVVRRLRDFFRAGSMRLQPINSSELLEMAKRVGVELTEGTEVSFVAQADPDIPTISADKVQIELVMRNLISNAVDSVAEHAPATGTIAVTIRRDAARKLGIVVADNGPGITAAARARLFHPLVSAKPSGMGLGLAVSRAIAEAHGGTLEVDSTSHGEFRLVLPLDPSHG